MEDRITGALQENLLTLLCFDKQMAPVIKNTVEIGLYSSDIFRDVAYEAVTFHDLFGVPIGDHLSDAFEEILNGRDQRKANLYKKILTNLRATKDSINKEYVFHSLNNFVKAQRLTKSVTDAAKFLRAGDTEAAEEELLGGLKTLEIGTFQSGMFLSDSPAKVLEHLRRGSNFISTGLPALDKISFGPSPKELMTILAPTSRGKTWFMVHLGKQMLLQRKKVLHITLEMSEEKIMTRYYQSFFSISRRQARIKVPEMQFDADGRFQGIEYGILKRPTFKSKGLAKLIKSKAAFVLNRYKLLVKEFPTGKLTIKQLEGYLDLIERQHSFIPDVILLDYADLMDIDAKNMRIDTGMVFRKLRGVMVERNIAGVTASQSNRLSEDVKWVTLKHLAEDYSKAATSDQVISICQSVLEKQSGMARLFVAKNRDEEDGKTVVITQGIAFGQFVLNSTEMLAIDSDNYWKEIKKNPSVMTDDA